MIDLQAADNSQLNELNALSFTMTQLIKDFEGVKEFLPLELIQQIEWLRLHVIFERRNRLNKEL